MQIIFKQLTLTNFKSHQELTVNFGERTVISGDNAKGKSSIIEAISWLLYGKDVFGSKLEPIPVTYEADETKAFLLIDVDGKEVLLGREIIKGKTEYSINETPKKATEFDETVDEIFDDEKLFFSLFNPNYFFTLHPTNEQRPMILNYVSAPANKEVFKELPEAQGKKLAELVKKKSMEDLLAEHRKNKTKLDKQYIRAQERVKTLKEELEQYKQLVPLSSLRTEKNHLEKQRNEKEAIIDSAGDKNYQISQLTLKIDNLTSQIDRGRDQHKALKERKIETTCFSCGQDLTQTAKNKAEKSKEENLQQIADQVNPLIKERKSLREELKGLTFVEVDQDLKDEVKAIQDKIIKIELEMDKHKQVEQLDQRIEDAQKEEKETLESLNESIFIIDSIKDFYAKEAELQAEKVQDLLDTLSIRLFKKQKNGEIKPDFAIQMDGKDYSKLSLSESIRAGLELREVLSEQSNIIAPVFVDNSESITKFKEPSGQLIMAKVVAGKELEVRTDD